MSSYIVQHTMSFSPTFLLPKTSWTKRATHKFSILQAVEFISEFDCISIWLNPYLSYSDSCRSVKIFKNFSKNKFHCNFFSGFSLAPGLWNTGGGDYIAKVKAGASKLRPQQNPLILWNRLRRLQLLKKFSITVSVSFPFSRVLYLTSISKRPKFSLKNKRVKVRTA